MTLVVSGTMTAAVCKAKLFKLITKEKHATFCSVTVSNRREKLTRGVASESTPCNVGSAFQ